MRGDWSAGWTDFNPTSRPYATYTEW